MMGELFPDPPIPERGIVLGTSGYSFADWVGPFYPPGTRPAEFLPYYARHFGAVEVNTTYYRMPSATLMERMERKTPPGFRFVVKLHQSMTHDLTRERATYASFLSALEPLRAAGKLDALLAQFPWGFKRTAEHAEHLGALRELLPREPLFVEFRNDSWNTPELAPMLRERRLGYCAVDEPPLPGLMPPITPLTAEDAYVRFHGRNQQTWWGRGGGDRYDYDYHESELREWICKIGDLATQARRTYLFFNNCHAGQAARNAKLMEELLRRSGQLL